MLEKTVEAYLVERVRAAGGDAYKFTSPQRRSVPDRIVVFPPGRLYFVELKRPGNKPTKPQLREHDRLRALGCDVRVIDSREGVDAFVQSIGAPPAPYLHVYEYLSPFGGVHREFEPNPLRGHARVVALYNAPQPTVTGRADVLTPYARGLMKEVLAALNDGVNVSLREELQSWLAASPVEQPAAAPIPADDLEQMTPNQRRAVNKGLAALETMADLWAAETRLTDMSQRIAAVADEAERAKRIAAMIHLGFVEGAYRHFLDHKDSQPAPAPADERAAFVKLMGYDRPETEGVAVDVWDSQRTTWLEALAFARAASANETGAEGAKPRMPTGDEVRHAVRSVGSLGTNHGDAPFEYVLAGWRAAMSAFSAPAQTADPDAIVRDNPDDIGTIIEATRPLAIGTKLYAAPQHPAQADARDGLTDAEIWRMWNSIDQNISATRPIIFARALLARAAA
ncbi:hypothetical protein [Burkholderia dolosa]|uniref:hypothetical protein n=1 Tax=Burkholderia dolosa TaxID=152500 RepID=UPI0020111E1D|nr:hypothetical protein [Burkholderia dolosa]